MSASLTTAAPPQAGQAATTGGSLSWLVGVGLAGLAHVVCVAPAQAQTTRCDFSVSSATPVLGGGTNGVNIDVTQQAGNTMSLGTFTRPDTGSATVQLQSNGTRSLPPTLTIQRDTLDVNKMPRVGIIEITGGANCKFRIDVDGTTGALFGVRLEAASGYAALSSSNPGATGRLNASGRHVVDMGVSATVDSAPSQTVFGSIVVRVTYVD